MDRSRLVLKLDGGSWPEGLRRGILWFLIFVLLTHSYWIFDVLSNLFHFWLFYDFEVIIHRISCSDSLTLWRCVRKTT